jgi:S-adenosylmethionine:tRNA ribosyltransferase-isomerase
MNREKESLPRGSAKGGALRGGKAGKRERINFNRELAKYDYGFPAALIARRPARPRDAARLLVSDRRGGAPVFSRFSRLADFLPPKAVLVFNETKVVPARLAPVKPTGGLVRVLVIGREGGLIRVMADRKIEAGSPLRLNRTVSFTVERRDGRFWLLKPSFPISSLDRVLERHGQAPLPPYIKSTPLTASEARREYQTVFARRRGSVAAPTASLHFTKRLMSELKRRGFGTEFVTLHVGLGTFAPVTGANLKKGTLHREHYEIGRAAARRLESARAAGRPIIAVGTTVVRTLESAAGNKGRLTRFVGDTDLFIVPGHRFRFVDGLITNFHVPKSSLMMLVAAFAGREHVLDLYRQAVGRRLRLFSFGDAMLIR